MTRLTQRPVAQYRDSEPFDAAFTVAGRPLRRIRDVWCGQTKAGTWRPARWLHRWPDELITVAYQAGAGDPAPTADDGIDGQMGLFG